MDGGDHLEDVTPYKRRNVERQNERNAGVLGLPREWLRDEVVDQGLKRPTPASWLGKCFYLLFFLIAGFLLHLILMNGFLYFFNLAFYGL